MDFTSLEFLFVFLPIFLAVYALSKGYTTRIGIVSVASLIFILAGPHPTATLFWLLVISVTTYTTGHFIEKNKQKNLSANTSMWIGILAILSTLVVFKALASGYGNSRINLFFCEQETNFFLCNKSKSFIIPLGISYISFQALSYVIDVFRRQISHESNFIKFTSYMLFYPKLVSGPITRFKSIREQLNTLTPTANDIAAGLRLILSGAAKRLLIANQAGIIANVVFGLPVNGITTEYAWMGLLAYTIQIYFDFSGYSDIAIGLAKTMGINLPDNFNYPYIAQSISDFWRRWHITLSSWFREYVFFPLERRRIKLIGRQFNILVVFFLTGIWHGFSLTFLVWGLIHGLFIAFESTIGEKFLNKLFSPLRHIYTLSIILVGWVFFRSPNLSFALTFITRLLGNETGASPLPFYITKPLPIIEPSFLLVMAVGILFSTPVFSIFKVAKGKFTERPSAFMAIQITEDILTIFVFALAIAAQIAGSFQASIYAKF